MNPPAPSRTPNGARFKLHCPEFDRLERIPDRYTAKGADISPPLRWSGAPADTAELALICEDPDAPLPRPFVHWILYGIQPNISAIPAGLPAEPELALPLFARQGKNSLQQIGFTGPNPPFWHGAHHYIFKLYALKRPIELWAGAGREDFYKAIESSVIAETRLVGLYEKPMALKAQGALTWAAAGVAAFGAALGAWKLLSPGQHLKPES